MFCEVVQYVHYIWNKYCVVSYHQLHEKLELISYIWEVVYVK